MIRKLKKNPKTGKPGEGWYVISESKTKDGKPAKVEGPFKTRKMAEKRLAQWEYFKYLHKK